MHRRLTELTSRFPWSQGILIWKAERQADAGPPKKIPEKTPFNQDLSADCDCIDLVRIAMTLNLVWIKPLRIDLIFSFPIVPV